MFDSQAEMLKEDVPTAAVGTYFEFYSTASDFAVVASKGIPNESQSKIPEWVCLSCARWIVYRERDRRSTKSH
jgi:hypothetical protein